MSWGSKTDGSKQPWWRSKYGRLVGLGAAAVTAVGAGIYILGDPPPAIATLAEIGFLALLLWSVLVALVQEIRRELWPSRLWGGRRRSGGRRLLALNSRLVGRYVIRWEAPLPGAAIYGPSGFFALLPRIFKDTETIEREGNALQISLPVFEPAGPSAELALAIVDAIHAAGLSEPVLLRFDPSSPEPGAPDGQKV